MGGNGGVRAYGDGEGVCKASGTVVVGLGDGMRVMMEAVRKIRQVVLHMLVRWEPRTYWVVKERIAMARQESEIVLEITSVMRNDGR